MSETILGFPERMSASTDKVNRSDAFYVNFVGFPENISNVLGKLVKSTSRPNISFQSSEVRHRAYGYQHNGNVTLEPISMIFYNDENAVVSTILQAQILRQLGKFRYVNGLWNPETFDKDDNAHEFGVQVKFYNSSGDLIDEYILEQAFITSINYDDHDMGDDSETTISVTIAYSNMKVKMFDEYVDFIKSEE